MCLPSAAIKPPVIRSATPMPGKTQFERKTDSVRVFFVMIACILFMIVVRNRFVIITFILFMIVMIHWFYYYLQRRLSPQWFAARLRCPNGRPSRCAVSLLIYLIIYFKLCISYYPHHKIWAQSTRIAPAPKAPVRGQKNRRGMFFPFFILLPPAATSPRDSQRDSDTRKAKIWAEGRAGAQSYYYHY